MKTRLILTLLVLVFVSCSTTSVFAQSESHEIGVRTSSLLDFDFIYKKGKSENKFTRYRLGATTLAFQNSEVVQNVNFAFAFAIGWEKRKAISDELQFIHGFEPVLTFGAFINKSNYHMNIIPGIGYVLGFQYTISKKFYVNIESIPTLSGSFFVNEDGIDDQFAINAGFNSNLVALSFVYTFQKTK